MTPVVVLTTVGTAFDVTSLARELVEMRLAACVNVVGPIHSIYRWKGSVEEEAERMLLIKTVHEKLPELRDALFARHPYEVPEFVVVPIERIDGPYRDWLLESMAS